MLILETLTLDLNPRQRRRRCAQMACLSAQGVTVLAPSIYRAAVRYSTKQCPPAGLIALPRKPYPPHVDRLKAACAVACCEPRWRFFLVVGVAECPQSWLGAEKPKEVLLQPLHALPTLPLQVELVRICLSAVQECRVSQWWWRRRRRRRYFLCRRSSTP